MINSGLKNALDFVEEDLTSSSDALLSRAGPILLGKKLADRLFVWWKTRRRKGPRGARRQKRRDEARARIAAAKASGDTVAFSDAAALVTNTGLHTALCFKVCVFLSVPYVVAPFQADPMLAGLPSDGSCVTVSADTDNLAFGVARWVSPVNWEFVEGTYKNGRLF
jgi:hypothetical protein